MSYSFRPAKRSEAKPLIGLYSESGCGKTLSALFLARGFAGPDGRVGMIETESGRGEAYADVIPGGYEVLSMREKYGPKDYGEALTAAEKATLDALIIDSASHEWEAAGGVLDMATANQNAGKRGVLAWQQPKMEHSRHFMLRLLATPIPLVIVCMRAKYPMREVKNNRGEKEWVRSDDLEPIQAADILFELFLHGWIDKAHKFHGTKYTRDELRQVIRDGESISYESGKRLAEWARDGGVKPSAAPATAPAATSKPAPAGPPEDGGKLLQRIKDGFAALALDDQAQRAAWEKHCKGVSFLNEQTDVVLLGDLYADLRDRARQRRSA